MALQQYCLRWKYHHSNLQTMFSQLLDRGCFCDVTLACEGRTLKAHRVVLCACSTYFDSILTNGCSDKDPIVIMKDCKFDDIKCLIEFMYKGEINVEHEQLASLLRTAEDLRIKGLAEVSWHDENGGEDKHKHTNKSNNNIRVGGGSGGNGGNGSASQSSSSGHPTTVRLPTKRNSISSNNSNQNHVSSDEAEHLAEITSRNDKEEMHHPIRLSAAAAVAPLLMPMDSPNTKQQNDHCITADEQTMPPVKKKRGRPPLDDDFDSYSTPRISHVEGATNSNYRRISQPTYDDNSVDHHQHHNNDPLSQPNSILEQSMEVQMDCDDDVVENIIPKVERPDTPASVKNYSYDEHENDYNPSSPKETDNDGYDAGLSTQVTLTPAEEAEWRDVIKMNDYLAKGRRPQFWEETFTKRVMEAIKTKDLEMKKAAQLLGVSYGTLYGRYRETYGCLKHPYRGPYLLSSLRDFLADPGHEDIIGRLQRGEITLPRAAELMNTSTTNLSGLLD